MSPADHCVPEHYNELFRGKCDALQQRFSLLTAITAERFASPAKAFRFRAEFSLWEDDKGLRYAMHEPGKRGHKIPIEQFPAGSALMQQLMPVLLQHISTSTPLKQKLFEVEFLTSRSGQALVTLIYHKVLETDWQTAARQMRQSLQDAFPQLHLIGRSRGQKLCLDQDCIEEIFTVQGRSYHYRQIEGSFTQPNAFINEAMLNWACTVTADAGGDLLELYCGNGNFTLPLSRQFRQVLATEVSKSSIAALDYNLHRNGMDNIALARLSGEETAQALRRTRPFRRLQHLDLDSYQFSTALVDPPRAGLDNNTLELLRSFDHICYISCNPDTLLANLEHLMTSHTIRQLAFFDQFPYTHHMECGVLLRKKP